MELADIEEWRPVVGYEGLYEVSNLGSVRSLDRVVTVKRAKSEYQTKIKGKILTPVFYNGYYKVSLYKAGMQDDLRVHRLVLFSFAGMPEENQQCLHINGDPLDNRLSNLRWGTASENTKDQVTHGTHKETSKVQCPRGHLLYGPNIAPYAIKRGKRECLACSRASSYHYKYGGDRIKLSHEYYKRIMNGS